jgi:hypothetical protein
MQCLLQALLPTVRIQTVVLSGFGHTSPYAFRTIDSFGLGKPEKGPVEIRVQFVNPGEEGKP